MTTFYHGDRSLRYRDHADMLLVQAGSGVATLGLPDSPGAPATVAADTLVANFNDLDSVDALLKKYPDQIAGITGEPMAGNMGVVSPQSGFLQIGNRVRRDLDLR